MRREGKQKETEWSKDSKMKDNVFISVANRRSVGEQGR